MDGETTGLLGDPLAATSAACPVHDVDALYRSHSARLVRLAAAITFDRDSALEIVHDAFAGLHRRKGSVVDADAYLHRSVVNLAIKALRRRQVRTRARPTRDLLMHQPEIDESLAAVLRLPPRQRAVVALRFWEDLSEADTAEVLGWPTGTVKSTLHRALQRLRKELQP